MSSDQDFRRMMADIRGPTSFTLVGNRTVHQFWKQLAPHFRKLFLVPQRRPDGSGVLWSWRAVGETKAPTTEELSEIRRALAAAAAAFAKTLADDPSVGAASPNALVAKSVGEMVAKLVAKNDEALTGFVVRTESGLMLHSWGAAVAATPFDADAREYAVSGKLYVGAGENAAGLSLVIENRQGAVLARTKTDQAGAFRFSEIASGSYRVRVTDKVDFPPGGQLVSVDRGSITGLEFRRGSLPTAGESATRNQSEISRVPFAGEEARAIAPRPRKRTRRRIAAVGASILLVGVVGWFFASRSNERSLIEAPVAKPPPVSAVGRRAPAERTLSLRDPANDAVARETKASGTFPASEKSAQARMNPNVNSAGAGAALDSKPDDHSHALGSATMPTHPSATSLLVSSAGGALGTMRDAALNPFADRPAASTSELVAASEEAGAPHRSDSKTNPTPPANPPPRAPTVTENAALLAAANADDAADAVAAFADQESGSTSKQRSGGKGSPKIEKSKNERAIAAGSEADVPLEADPEPVLEVADNTRLEPPPDEPAGATAETPVAEAELSRSQLDARGPFGRIASDESSSSARSGFEIAGSARWAQQRIAISPWKLRMMHDEILPTLPVAEEDEAGVQLLREKIQAELAAKIPESLRGARVVAGISYRWSTLPGSKQEAPLWEIGDGIAQIESSVQDDKAELSWSGQQPPANLVCILRSSRGAELLRARFDQAGALLISTSAVSRTSLWVGVERGRTRETKSGPALAASALQWRLVSGAALPASWERDDFWRGGRGQRVDLPLASAPPAQGRYALALVDPPTDWALSGEIKFR